ncbi:PREDICTED: TBC1 domain family member 2B-like [Acropora digitifera]|uniref:TBC1 domain family member 2B-like n=1 Tax=Acropora digitifera TaxID=70779 RepID=UPI00077A4A14|nr:PREDICTED: TBC1 domain family member 2B-like [Acropora digitifera]
MPNNEKFRCPDSDGVKKLSRILRAFCVHRPDISYLQGMNFIVAMCLLFMEEEDAFWGLVAVVECYLHNYFDRSLSGALADQSVLKELLNESLPALHAHLKYYSVDVSAVTFNWFITIFIDAVPFETALWIWDCFVFEGRQVLFRIALGVLKVQQSALLQLFCPLEIMQYMKRAARVTYDKDQLSKSSYEELKVFPTVETLDEKQANYLAIAKSGQSQNGTLTRDERERSRVSSFTVEIPDKEKPDKPDQHEILECALATSRDMSSPVCLFCGSRYTANVYLLDITKKEMRQLDVDLKSRVLCTDMLDDGTILVGTVSWYIHAFNLKLSSEVWRIKLSESVIDIAHLPGGGRVFAA